MSFTFIDNETFPIAIIKDKNRKLSELIYLSDESAQETKSNILNEVLDPSSLQFIMSSLSNMSINSMVNIIKSSNTSSNKNFKSYEINSDECIETLPSEKSERVYVAGEAGCGKSTITAKYAREYLKMYPSNKIFFFLRQDDEAFDDIPGNFIILDFDYNGAGNREDLDDLMDGNIRIDSLENSLCIFDDCDNLQDKKLSTAIHKLMNDVTTNGRKKKIYTIYISHLILNYSQTRVMLNEANKVFFFPGCGTRQIENFLKTYGSMKNKEAERIATINSRWCMFSRKRPRYILHEKGIFMV